MPGLRNFGVALAATVVLTANAAYAQRSALQPSPLPSELVLNRYDLTRAWWGHATLDEHRDKLLYLTLGDDKIFAQGSNGAVTAFDSETGKRLWATQLGVRDTATFPATLNEEVLLVVTGLDLYALDKETGVPRWNLKLPRYPSSSPSADERNVYLGFLDGSVSAFDLHRINELYHQGRLPQYSYATVSWRFRTSTEIRIPPLSTGKFVDFANMGGTLYAVSRDDRQLMFRFQTAGAITAPLVKYEDSLLLASQDFRLYSLDSQNGAIRWQFATGLKIARAPQVIDHDLFLMPERGGMHRLNPRDGEQVWWRPELVDFLAASPSHIYATDRSHNLAIIARDDGSALGTLPMEAFSIHLANDRNDRVYLATPQGLIVCLHERDREFPAYYKYPERQPVLPEFAPEPDAAEQPAEAPAEPAADKPAEPDAQ